MARQSPLEDGEVMCSIMPAGEQHADDERLSRQIIIGEPLAWLNKKPCGGEGEDVRAGLRTLWSGAARAR